MGHIWDIYGTSYVLKYGFYDRDQAVLLGFRLYWTVFGSQKCSEGRSTANLAGIFPLKMGERAEGKSQ
jgi:hypothetical protein